MLDTVNLREAARVPCAPHWWGVYKYEALGLDPRLDAWKTGTELAKVYIDFYEMFRPDWFHLHIGTPVYFEDSEIVERDGSSVLIIDPPYRGIKKEDKYFSSSSSNDEEIVDFPDYLLKSRAAKPRVDLWSARGIDEYVRRYVFMEAALVEELGYTDHVKRIAAGHGKEAFIAVHIPSAVCEIFDPTTGFVGFEEGLVAFHDSPGGMLRLFEKCYEAQLEWAKAYAAAGAHAYAISESYLSPDIAGPDVYTRYLKAIHRDYFKEVERLGLVPILSFWGDPNPLLDVFTEINARALMVEESKKTFTIDIRKIRDRVGGRLCVFGNIDSITLLHDGRPEDVRAEVLRQAEGSRGNFVVSNASPITPGTPKRNVKTMIDVAKQELRPLSQKDLP
jgi:hypothetical protein